MNLLRGPQPLLHQPSPQPVAQVNLLGTPIQPALSLNSLSTRDDAFTCQTGRTPFLQPCSTGILAKATRTAQAHSTLPLLPSVNLPYQLEFAAHRNSFSLLSQYNHVTEDPLGQWHAQSSTQRTCTGVQESSDAPSGNAHLPARRHLSKDLSHASGRMRHVTSFGEWTPSDWKLARVGSWQTEEHDRSGVASAAGRLDKELCLRGKGLLAVSAGSLHEACLWNSLRVLRLARNMHVQSAAHVPVVQPVRLTAPWQGLPTGSMLLYTHSMLAGHILPAAVMQVSNTSDVNAVASALLAKLFQEGCHVVALDAAGQQATLIGMRAVEVARAALARHHATQQARQRKSGKGNSKQPGPSGQALNSLDRTNVQAGLVGPSSRRHVPVSVLGPKEDILQASSQSRSSNTSSTSSSSSSRTSSQGGPCINSPSSQATSSKSSKHSAHVHGDLVLGRDVAMVLECGLRMGSRFQGPTMDQAQGQGPPPLLVNRLVVYTCEPLHPTRALLPARPSVRVRPMGQPRQRQR